MSDSPTGWSAPDLTLFPYTLTRSALKVHDASSGSRRDGFPMPVVEHGRQDTLLTNSETRIKAGEVHNAGQPNLQHIQQGMLQARAGLADALTPNPDGDVLCAQHDRLSSQRRRAYVDSRPESLNILKCAAKKLCTRLKIPVAYRYISVGLQEIVFNPAQVSIYPTAPHLLLGTLALLVFHRLSPSPDGMPVGAIHWNRVGPRRLKAKCRTVFRVVAQVMGVDFHTGWRKLYDILLDIGKCDRPVTAGWAADVPAGGGRGGTAVLNAVASM
jgi:hypothetical protein